MKAVVLETKDGYCAVLKDDGTIEKLKMTAEVGQEITMPTKKEIRRFPLRYIAAAASFALVTLTSGFLALTQEYSYVSVDVDASVEYSLDRMDRVVRVKGLNKKGETLADSIRKEGVEGQSFSKAMDKTKSLLEEEGYMNADNGAILMAVSSKNEKKSTALKQQVEVALETDALPTCIGEVSLAERKDAQSSGLSTGRYAVVKEIVGDETLNDEAIDIAKSKSASDLIHIVEENVSVVSDQPEPIEEAWQDPMAAEATDETVGAQGMDAAGELSEANGEQAAADESLHQKTDVEDKVTVDKKDSKKDAKKASADRKNAEDSAKTKKADVQDQAVEKIDSSESVQEAVRPSEPEANELTEPQQLTDAIAPLNADNEIQGHDAKITIHDDSQVEAVPQDADALGDAKDMEQKDVPTASESQPADVQEQDAAVDNKDQEQKEAVTTTKSKDDTEKKGGSLGDIVREKIKDWTD